MNENKTPTMSLEVAVEELLRATGQLLRRLRSEANPGELTWSQNLALAQLDKRGPLTTADLARAEGVKPQSMGTTLSDLEQAGYILRQPHPTDGRQILFELTEQGRAIRRQRTLLKRARLTAAMAKLDPDEQQTLIAAISLIKRLGEDA